MNASTSGRGHFVVVAILGAALAVTAAFSYRNSSHAPPGSVAHEPPAARSTAARAAGPRPTASDPGPATSARPRPRRAELAEQEGDATLRDEATITRRLRELGQREPELTLELAREGNQRFADGPDAAERNWYLVRALVNLERFPEAKQRAKWMVEHFGSNHFSEDVRRHLLVQPLGQPTREEIDRIEGR